MIEPTIEHWWVRLKGDDIFRLAEVTCDADLKVIGLHIAGLGDVPPVEISTFEMVAPIPLPDMKPLSLDDELPPRVLAYMIAAMTNNSAHRVLRRDIDQLVRSGFLRTKVALTDRGIEYLVRHGHAVHTYTTPRKNGLLVRLGLWLIGRT